MRNVSLSQSSNRIVLTSLSVQDSILYLTVPLRSEQTDGLPNAEDVSANALH